MADQSIVYAEPQVRAYREWTPGLLRSAEVQADGGTLGLASDLCESLFSDDRVKAVLDTRTDALLSLPLSFEAGLGRRKRAAVRALDLEEDWWSGPGVETELKLLQAWGLALGVGLAENVWVEHGSRVVPRLVVKHPRHLRYDHAARTWMLTVDNPRREIPIVPGDGKWVLYTPYGSMRPWSHGAYRALSRWALLKYLAISDWGFYSERHGNGTLVVTGANGTAEQRREIAADLQNLGRNSSLALPEGFKLELLEATAKTYETFVSQINAADNGFAVSLLGQNLTTQVTAGSHAAATVHGRVALGRTRSDAETLATCLHWQVLRPWAEYNFGDVNLAPWPKWDAEPTQDVKERAAVLQMVAQAISTMTTAGAPIDVRALLEDFGVPMLATDPVPDPAPGSQDK